MSETQSLAACGVCRRDGGEWNPIVRLGASSVCYECAAEATSRALRIVEDAHAEARARMLSDE
jgi:hypothetical protein